MKLRASVLALGVSLAACTPTPRPGILAEVDRARTGAAAREATSLSPQAYLAAEKLRADAIALDDAGDRAGASILGEQALAAYARAGALARLARADERLSAANRSVDGLRVEVAKVEEEERRIAAEAMDLEARVRVARDALPLAPSEPASPDRERARLAAARALSTQARLLCVAAELLTADAGALADTWKSIATLDAELARVPAKTPIDEAVRLRSKCLSALTLARRPATRAAPEEGKADALFTELSQGGAEPTRDDRGVFVVLRDVFQGSGVADAASRELARLGQVARAHADFPVVAVVHGARGRPGPRDTARAAALSAALEKAGAVRVKVELAGDALPVAPPNRGDSARRNERVEVVFVAPSL